MEVNVHHGKTRLSRLIAAAEAGEEVIIARDGNPAVKLVRIVEKKPSRRGMLGGGIGKIWMAADFDSEATNSKIADMFEEGGHIG